MQALWSAGNVAGWDFLRSFQNACLHSHRTSHKLVECLERYTSVARCHELAEASLVLPEALPFVSYVITSVRISLLFHKLYITVIRHWPIIGSKVRILIDTAQNLVCIGYSLCPEKRNYHYLKGFCIIFTAQNLVCIGNCLCLEKRNYHYLRVLYDFILGSLSTCLK